MTHANSKILAGAAGLVLVALGMAIGAFLLPGGRPDKAATEQIVHDYLLAHPQILVELSNRLDAVQEAADDNARNEALAKIGRAALTDPKLAFVIGPADAKVTVAEFFDYRCPHCKASLQAVKDVIEKDHVRFAFIEHPILTPDSLLAAKAAVASRRQGDQYYMPFHYALMATEGALPRERILDIAKSVGLDPVKLGRDMDDPAIAETVSQSNALAHSLHVDGTPTFVVNDKFVVGEVTDADLTSIVKAAQS